MQTMDTTTCYTRTIGEIQQLRSAGLGQNAHECMLLLALLDEGPIPMSNAARLIGISRAAMTSMVDRLGLVGLVVRNGSTEDRRITDVSLTNSGLAKVHNALEELA